MDILQKLLAGGWSIVRDFRPNGNTIVLSKGVFDIFYSSGFGKIFLVFNKSDRKRYFAKERGEKQKEPQ
jgi:hypothetical protein